MTIGVIAQIGTINIASLNVPQVVVQIVPPQFLFGGVQSNIGGIVGTSSWGPVNSPQAFGTVAQGTYIFGPTINRLYDIMGHGILAFAQGASFLYGVRVTDGTDTAASLILYSTAPTYATGTITFSLNPSAAATITLNGTAWTFVSAYTTGTNQILIGSTLAITLATAQTLLNASTDTNTAKMTYSCSGTVITATAVSPTASVGNALTLAASVATATSPLSGGVNGTVGSTITSAYTGSLANTMVANISAGTKLNTFKLVLAMPGYTPEVYDNIAGTGNAFWVNLTAAVNSGNSPTRGPSFLATASAGAGTSLPLTTLVSYKAAGGTDGTTAITTAVLLGQDSLPRSGMYALRNTNCSKAMLADCSDSTSWLTQESFGLSIGCEMIICTAAGDTIANAQYELANAGVDTFTLTCMFGDWIYFLDSTNNVPQRLISPQSCKLGVLCSLSPQNSPLNKPITGIIGTQKSLTGIPYTTSDLQVLGSALMDVIGDPAQGGNYFACLFGKNCSSQAVTQGDEYTQVTYWLAKSLLTIGGPYIGQTITPDEMLRAKTSIQQFLALAAIPVAQGGPGIIGNAAGTQPYQVTLDLTNNTQSTIALGFQYAYVKVDYYGIVRYFIFSLEGGSSVIISNTSPTGNQ